MKSILIVEDEILIASAIKRNLVHNGYHCVGIAVDYEEAMQYLKSVEIDLILLDVNISSELNGVGLANIINQKYNIPFIFITSYRDEPTIAEILNTNPVAYLSKPIDQLSLLTNLKIFFTNKKNNDFVLQLGSTRHLIDLEELRYIKVDHVYLELYYENQREVIRASLNILLEQLSNNQLIRINRSLAVNPNYITKIAKRKLYLGELQFPISPLYKANLNTLSL